MMKKSIDMWTELNDTTNAEGNTMNEKVAEELVKIAKKLTSSEEDDVTMDYNVHQFFKTNPNGPLTPEQIAVGMDLLARATSAEYEQTMQRLKHKLKTFENEAKDAGLYLRK